jgi:Ca2+-binding EF-hand superfamily protein
MKSTRNSPRRASLAAMAAFGIASFGLVSVAGAHPNHTTPVPRPAPVPAPGHYDDQGYGYERPDYDLDDDGVLEHVEIDYRHYDRNRDGFLNPTERTAYWRHMFDMGKFGRGFTRSDVTLLSRIAFLFDTDGDGRLTQEERVAISRMIRARKQFVELDRNRDNNLTRREAGLTRRGPYGPYYLNAGSAGQYNFNLYYWSRVRAPEPMGPRNWMAQRFETMDRNDNGRVSWQEVQSHIIVSFRRGTRP